MENVGFIVGPLIGFLVVILAYCLGILLYGKCCRLEFSESMMSQARRDPNLDIFIVSRSEEYLVSIPRPALMPSRNDRIRSGANVTPESPAPEYEEPPSYDDCIKNGIV